MESVGLSSTLLGEGFGMDDLEGNRFDKSKKIFSATKARDCEVYCVPARTTL